ncbi:MAG: rRNA maturation RNase YbeY [Patescibacteria group bacterium]
MSKLELRLARLTSQLLRILQPKRASAAVDVFFLPNAVLRRSKRDYLKKDVAFVDVLAFPAPRRFPRPDRPEGYLGEIYLNEAFRRGSAKELVSMLIHGTLHLSGYRHGGKRDTIRMERQEEKLLARFRFSGQTFRFLADRR